MSLPFKQPPLGGSVTVLPGFVDFHAEHNPNSVWAVFPSLDDPDGKTFITYSELAQASHRVAHAVRPGRKGPEQEVVAILVNCDTVHYVTLLVGLRRAGIVPFPMSPKNSPEAVCHMLKTTNCHRVIQQASLSALTSMVKESLAAEGYSVELEDLPAFAEIYPGLAVRQGDGHAEFSSYPPPEAPYKASDLAIYIHSSGSTGLPKSIAWTEKIFLLWADSYIIRMSYKYQLRWACMALPAFHSIGIVGQVLTPMMSGMPVALFTPQAPAPPIQPNPKNMLDVAVATDSNAIAVVPIFIEMWCRSPETIKYLASLECLCWAGGPLSQSNGDQLVAAGVNLAIIYGTTESGIMNKVMDLDFSPNPRPDAKRPQDWNWMQLDERLDCRWVDQGDGTYELEILSSETYPLAVENLPDVAGYATNDVFKPHPTQPGLWAIVGRTDDVIVLRSGEKVVPLPQEDYLNSVPMIASAIMFGRGQSQPGVIVELMPEYIIDVKVEGNITEMRSKLWPYVEEANQRAPAWSRIFKETILIADFSKPFARAAKGTAIRKVVLKSYEQEIDEVYKRIEESTDAQGVYPPETWDINEVEAWLNKHAASINKGSALDPTVDLFEQGFDSLSATYLRNRVIGALRSSKDKSIQSIASHIPQEFVFQNPTILRLSTAIVALVEPSFKLSSLPLTEVIQGLIEKYSTKLPSFKPYQPPARGAVVLLTGSTGALGSHILASLLSDDSVAEVFTLNRGGNVEHRQRSSFEERGLSVELLARRKLTSLVGDIHHSNLGLPEARLHDVRNRITHIVHNAWKVDFNLSLSSFETYLASTRNLINLSHACYNPVRFLFTSSVAAVYGWDKQRGPVPEQAIDDPKIAAVSSGYGASKYIAEHIGARAVRQGLSATSVRIGQICGSTTSGDWNTSEWFPTLFKSSLSMGQLPDIPGDVSWIPMDITAQTIIDVLLSSSPVPDVVNIAHPRPAVLRDIFDALNVAIGGPMEMIPSQQWITKLQTLSTGISPQDVQRYPAIKLLGFFSAFLGANQNAGTSNAEAGGMPALQTMQAQAISKTLRGASSIGRPEAELWVRFWQKAGFIQVDGLPTSSTSE